MFGRLLPKETSFFDFFEEHARLTVTGTTEFVSMVSSANSIDAKAKRIKEIEHETDVITHRCVEALHTVFITPIERDDIYRLITRMDDVMDFVEAAAERLALTPSSAARWRACSSRYGTRSRSSSGRRSTKTWRVPPTGARTSRTSSRALSSTTPEQWCPPWSSQHS